MRTRCCTASSPATSAEPEPTGRPLGASRCEGAGSSVVCLSSVPPRRQRRWGVEGGRGVSAGTAEWIGPEVACVGRARVVLLAGAGDRRRGEVHLVPGCRLDLRARRLAVHAGGPLRRRDPGRLHPPDRRHAGPGLGGSSRRRRRPPARHRRSRGRDPQLGPGGPGLQLPGAWPVALHEVHHQGQHPGRRRAAADRLARALPPPGQGGQAHPAAAAAPAQERLQAGQDRAADALEGSRQFMAGEGDRHV
ncbi:hypothetical protein NODU109028_21550 [Nocardioides dubius]